MLKYLKDNNILSLYNLQYVIFASINFNIHKNKNKG